MSLIERIDKDQVAYIKFTSPERLNALSDEMISVLQAQFDSLASEKNIRVVVLSGSGKAFCAGHDLKQMSCYRQAKDGGASYYKDLFDRCARMMISILQLPQPVIAQVHGIATAAGCQLVASCDLAVAETEAKFGVNGVNIGLFCSTPMVALSRNVPAKKAFEMLTTGQFIDAKKAESLGLINTVVSRDKLEEKTQELANTIASKLSSAVMIGKKAFYEQLMMPMDRAYSFTGDVMVRNMLLRDTEEGIAAFLEKRKPNWQND
ncbi:MAG: enoyl-CoA hydratase [Aestuariivita sp.]|nr:enoyl-CoA hydratase [Aestuariivita sp.]